MYLKAIVLANLQYVKFVTDLLNIDFYVEMLIFMWYNLNRQNWVCFWRLFFMKRVSFFLILFILLLPVTAWAAPAQRYSLMVNGSKLTAYLAGDEVYIRPEELASVCKGTNFAFDVSYVEDAYKITLKSDFSGDLPKFKSKAAYDDAVVSNVTFTVEGFDAAGSLNTLLIEEKPFLKLKDMGSIVGFGYTRNKNTGIVILAKQPSGSAMNFDGAFSAGRYIDMVSDMIYSSVLASDNMRVAAHSADMLKVEIDFTS